MLVERLGERVKCLHTPSHIEIPGNHGADHLADVGRRRSPLLFGHISARLRQTDLEEEEEDAVEGEEGGALSAVRAQCNYLGVWPYPPPLVVDDRMACVTGVIW